MAQPAADFPFAYRLPTDVALQIPAPSPALVTMGSPRRRLVVLVWRSSRSPAAWPRPCRPVTRRRWSSRSASTTSRPAPELHERPGPLPLGPLHVRARDSTPPALILRTVADPGPGVRPVRLSQGERGGLRPRGRTGGGRRPAGRVPHVTSRRAASSSRTAFDPPDAHPGADARHAPHPARPARTRLSASPSGTRVAPTAPCPTHRRPWRTTCRSCSPTSSSRCPSPGGSGRPDPEGLPSWPRRSPSRAGAWTSATWETMQRGNRSGEDARRPALARQPRLHPTGAAGHGLRRGRDRHPARGDRRDGRRTAGGTRVDAQLVELAP